MEGEGGGGGRRIPVAVVDVVVEVSEGGSVWRIEIGVIGIGFVVRRGRRSSSELA